jgi:hypothetical protein
MLVSTSKTIVSVSFVMCIIFQLLGPDRLQLGESLFFAQTVCCRVAIRAIRGCMDSTCLNATCLAGVCGTQVVV